jgi:hypothetical protein
VTTALLVVVCSPAAAQSAQGQGQQFQRPNPTRPVIESIGGFSVVLVLGESQPSGAAATDALPGGAKKALSDMREFLPYKSYRVLDTQWTSCCSTRSTTTVGGRLEGVVGIPGPNGSVTLSPRGYAFNIGASMSNTNIPVRFVLMLEDLYGRRASDSADRARELEREKRDLEAEIVSIQSQLRELQQRVEVGLAPASDLRPLRDRQSSLQRRVQDLTADMESAAQAGGRAIIDSSFTMDAGETVVVGTSKLGGDKALIAIVTAVRKGGSTR